MLKKLKAMANRPKMAPTRNQLMWTLAWQAVLLLIILVVVTFWPERAFALTGFTFLSLGIAALLWVEVYDGLIVGASAQPANDQGK